jgi:hypothetical protein
MRGLRSPYGGSQITASNSPPIDVRNGSCRALARQWSARLPPGLFAPWRTAAVAVAAATAAASAGRWPRGLRQWVFSPSTPAATSDCLDKECLSPAAAATSSPSAAAAAASSPSAAAAAPDCSRNGRTDLLLERDVE